MVNVDDPRARLLPTLQAHDWVCEDEALRRPLCDGDSRWLPWVSWAVMGEGEGAVVSGPDDGGLRPVMESMALETLEGLGVEVALQSQAAYPLVEVSGNEWAAEFILSAGTLVRVQELLGAQEILVGIGARGTLKAVDAELGSPFLPLFREVVTQAFHFGGLFGITPLTFRVKDGRILGWLEPVDPDGLLEFERPKPVASASGDSVRVTTAGFDWHRTSHAAVQVALTNLVLQARRRETPAVLTLSFPDQTVVVTEGQALARFFIANNPEDVGNGAARLAEVRVEDSTGVVATATPRRLPWGFLVFVVVAVVMALVWWLT